MASDYIKNIILDEKNNKIIADIADGNILPLTFLKQRSLYSHIDSYEEKYGTFIYDLVSGSIRCMNEVNKLNKLSSAKALRNYYDDFRVLGAKEVYKKYQDTIYKILYENLANDKQEVIPSELDLHYSMKTLNNRTFKDISKIFYSLETITENKNLSIDKKREGYYKFLNIYLDKDEINKPLFILYNKNNPKILVEVYPELRKNTYKDDIYLTYYFDIKNLETNYGKIYEDNGMMISYILDDEKRTKQILQGMEQEFIEDEKRELARLQELEELGEQE